METSRAQIIQAAPAVEASHAAAAPRVTDAVSTGPPLAAYEKITVAKARRPASAAALRTAEPTGRFDELIETKADSRDCPKEQKPRRGPKPLVREISQGATAKDANDELGAGPQRERPSINPFRFLFTTLRIGRLGWHATTRGHFTNSRNKLSISIS